VNDPRLQGLRKDDDGTAWNGDGLEVVQLPHGNVCLLDPATWRGAENENEARFFAILDATAEQHSIDHACRIMDFRWRSAPPGQRISTREFDLISAPLIRRWLNAGHDFKSPVIELLAMADRQTVDA
jgi:hypothetical protein